MLQRSLKISLILTFSFLVSCAGNPPKLERQIKLWNGTPERQALCRTTVDKAVAFAKRNLKTDQGKSMAGRYMGKALAADAVECIKADQREFAAFVGLTAADLGVLLRYQEDLLFKCAKWNQ